MFSQLKIIVDKVLQLKQEKQSVTKEKLITKIKEAEAEEQERLRVQAELEEERRKMEEGNEGEDNPDQPQQEEKVENKVQKPDPVGDKIGPKEPSLENIDSDFRPVILKLWKELSSNYKR